jgi:hypothetical protein
VKRFYPPIPRSACIHSDSSTPSTILSLYRLKSWTLPCCCCMSSICRLIITCVFIVCPFFPLNNTLSGFRDAVWGFRSPQPRYIFPMRTFFPGSLKILSLAYGIFHPLDSLTYHRFYAPGNRLRWIP